MSDVFQARTNPYFRTKELMGRLGLDERSSAVEAIQLIRDLKDGAKKWDEDTLIRGRESGNGTESHEEVHLVSKI